MVQIIADIDGQKGSLVKGGPVYFDSVISGSLASPKSPDGGEPEEHGDEANETESRGGIQGQGGRGGVEGRQDSHGVCGALYNRGRIYIRYR